MYPRGRVFILGGVEGGGEGEGIFGFLLFISSSHYVLIKFPMGPQHVPQVNNVFLNMSLNMFPIALHFLSYALPNLVFLEVI
jgi:hypothetical protein